MMDEKYGTNLVGMTFFIVMLEHATYIYKKINILLLKKNVRFMAMIIIVMEIIVKIPNFLFLYSQKPNIVSG